MQYCLKWNHLLVFGFIIHDSILFNIVYFNFSCFCNSVSAPTWCCPLSVTLIGELKYTPSFIHNTLMVTLIYEMLFLHSGDQLKLHEGKRYINISIYFTNEYILG